MFRTEDLVVTFFDLLQVVFETVVSSSQCIIQVELGGRHRMQFSGREVNYH